QPLRIAERQREREPRALADAGHVDPLVVDLEGLREVLVVGEHALLLLAEVVDEVAFGIEPGEGARRDELARARREKREAVTLAEREELAARERLALDAERVEHDQEREL